MSSLRSMHLRLSIKGGSIVDGKEKEGLAHFMEHMLVQGIPSFPSAQELSAFSESLAGSYNAYTSQLTVSFAMTVPFIHTEDAIKIGSEVFFAPLFPQESIEKERRAVLNEIKQDQDSRWFKFQEFFRVTRLAQASPLQTRTVGSPDIVQQLQRDDFITYWKEYFVPENTYLFLIGNLEQQRTKALLEQYFGQYPASKKDMTSIFPKLSSDDLADRQVVLRTDNELQVNYFDLTFPALSMDNDLKTRMAQNIALIILGRLRTSRLFQLLRYQKGLVYGVSSNDSQWLGTGYAYISSEISNEHLDEVIQLIVTELKKFMQFGPTEKELAFTKHYLSNSWLMSFDNPSSIIDWVSNEFLWKEKILLPEDCIQLVETITVADLVNVMQNHWDMQKLQLTIQGPIKDTATNRKKFTQMIKDL
jgi:predicted Zn-dependent peptidase